MIMRGHPVTRGVAEFLPISAAPAHLTPKKTPDMSIKF